MSLYFQVYTKYTFIKGKPQLIGLSLHSTTVYYPWLVSSYAFLSSSFDHFQYFSESLRIYSRKLAIEWVMERYAITTHKENGIKNDLNDWAVEHERPAVYFGLVIVGDNGTVLKLWILWRNCQKRIHRVSATTIILTDCGWIDAKEISKHLALPTDGKPVNTYGDSNTA